jgi:hypothetical protein
MMLAPEYVPHSRTVHVPFQEEPTRHLKRRATADNRRLSLLGIGVADAGNAGGTQHNPPAVLAGYGCGEHAEGERRRDDEVASGRFRRRHMSVNAQRRSKRLSPAAGARPRRRPQPGSRYAKTGTVPEQRLAINLARFCPGRPSPSTTIAAILVTNRLSHLGRNSPTRKEARNQGRLMARVARRR